MSENAFTPALGRVVPTRFYDHVIDRDAPVVQGAERHQQASSPEAPMPSGARPRRSLSSERR